MVFNADIQYGFQFTSSRLSTAIVSHRSEGLLASDTQSQKMNLHQPGHAYASYHAGDWMNGTTEQVLQ